MSEAKELVLIGKGNGEEAEAKMRFKFFPELYVPGSVKSKKVMITALNEEGEEHIVEMEWENFNNFCLDLFNEHKKIMAARNS